MAPLHANPLFPPSLHDNAFESWCNKGVAFVKDFYVDGVFASFKQLIDQSVIPRSHRFRHFQVRNFVRKRYPDFPSIPPSSSIDALLDVDPDLRGAIITVYNHLFAL